jgi:hypothetical protein
MKTYAENTYAIDRNGIDPAQPRKRFFRVWRGPDLVADGFLDRYGAQRWIKADRVARRQVDILNRIERL